jgi:hypothetical protein
MKRYQKIISALAGAVFFAGAMGLSSAATPETVQDKLAVVEQDTYGEPQTGAIMERIHKLEKDYTGQNATGSMMSRTDKLYDAMYKNGTKPSLLAELNGIEWTIRHEVSSRPVQTRLGDMENEMDGKTATGTFSTRIRQLADYAFGENKLPISATAVPANTLVKIKLTDRVNAKNLKQGDIVHYAVADDVVVDGRLVFAKGAPGEGVVQKVQQARNFGRNAEVTIDFNKTKAMDGTEVTTYVGKEAQKEMKQLAMAAGASVAGMVILGPIGIIGGAFVHGKNVDLPVGTELYIQTKADEQLFGVQTTLSEQ